MPYAVLGGIGKYTVAEGLTVTNNNPCVILTLDCFLEFMGDITGNSYTANTVMATLPDNLASKERVSFTVPLSYEGDSTYADCYVDGKSLRCETSFISTFKLKLNGANVNVCASYYTNAIGNNDNVGTSELTETLA